MASVGTVVGIEARYRERTPGSRAMWERAKDVLPQGISGAAKFYAPYPLFVSGADGGHITDVDGRDYVDFLMGAGPNLLGHRHPQVIDAVRRQLDIATQTMSPTELEIAYAERLRGHMPYLERIRFTNTGSEADRSVARLARVFTGRRVIGKFEGNYHGSEDLFQVSANVRRVDGPAERPLGVADSAGISAAVLDEVLVLPYNDAAHAVALIEARADELAAVIMEPVAFSSGGGIMAEPAFARAVRDVTARHEILLIFDEIVTGLRLGLGGAPSYLGVTPDLSCLGKAIGGGFPIGGFGGRAEVMERGLAGRAEDRIFQSGTYTANPVSLAAGMAVLDVLESHPVLAHVDALGSQLREALDARFRARGVEACMTGVGSIFQVHFAAKPPRNRRDVLAGDHERTRLFLLGLVAEGILWPPIHPGVVAAPHTVADLDRLMEAADRVLSGGLVA